MPASEQAQATITGYPAGLARRVGALLYDALLIIALWMATLLPWVVANGGNVVSGPLLQAILLLELTAFYLYSWSKQGQTLGMKTWRIKLVDKNGQRPTFRQLLLRLLTAPLSWLSGGLGYVWLYVGGERQTWHDRLSQTMVVHLPR